MEKKEEIQSSIFSNVFDAICSEGNNNTDKIELDNQVIKDKDKLVLVCYIGVSKNLKADTAKHVFSETKTSLESMFDDSVKVLCIPTIDSSTKIECFSINGVRSVDCDELIQILHSHLNISNSENENDTSTHFSLNSNSVSRDGVFILHKTLGVKTSENWNKKNNDGVIGILVVDNGHSIVVAKDETEKCWAKDYGNVEGITSTYHTASALRDFDGLKNTTCMKGEEYPAANFCYNYNKFDKQWWLPSAGEMNMIFEHKDEINSLLELVGGTMLLETWYWTSTEGSSSYAWALTLHNGTLYYWYTKINYSHKVRPVSVL